VFYWWPCGVYSEWERSIGGHVGYILSGSGLFGGHVGYILSRSVPLVAMWGIF
jgi:hypothetical protein